MNDFMNYCFKYIIKCSLCLFVLLSSTYCSDKKPTKKPESENQDNLNLGKSITQGKNSGNSINSNSIVDSGSSGNNNKGINASQFGGNDKLAEIVDPSQKNCNVIQTSVYSSNVIAEEKNQNHLSDNHNNNDISAEFTNGANDNKNIIVSKSTCNISVVESHNELTESAKRRKEKREARRAKRRNKIKIQQPSDNKKIVDIIHEKNCPVDDKSELMIHNNKKMTNIENRDPELDRINKEYNDKLEALIKESQKRLNEIDHKVYEDVSKKNNLNDEKNILNCDFDDEDNNLNDDFDDQKNNLNDDLHDEDNNLNDDFDDQKNNLNDDLHDEENNLNDDFNDQKNNLNDDLHDIDIADQMQEDRNEEVIDTKAANAKNENKNHSDIKQVDYDCNKGLYDILGKYIKKELDAKKDIQKKQEEIKLKIEKYKDKIKKLYSPDCKMYDDKKERTKSVYENCIEGFISALQIGKRVIDKCDASISKYRKKQQALQSRR